MTLSNYTVNRYRMTSMFDVCVLVDEEVTCVNSVCYVGCLQCLNSVDLCLSSSEDHGCVSDLALNPGTWRYLLLI